MSKYTTGEIAKLCGVSVRTVQYYDERNILVPGELSEGGRRLYTDDDLRKMKIICFLRQAGISINSIAGLFEEENPGDVISLLLEQQEQQLDDEVAELREKLELIAGIKKELKEIENFSVETIGDIAYVMKSKKQLKKLHLFLLCTGIPLDVFQCVSIVLWIVTGVWWPFVLWGVIAVIYGIWISKYYFSRVAYICPRCHTVFKPRFKEAFWANHTPTLRKLTCTSCGQKGFCVETYGKDDNVK